MTYQDLGEFLAALDRDRMLVRVSRPVDLNLEVGKALRQAYARGGPAVLFSDTGTPYPLVAGLFSTRRHAALAFETTEDQLLDTVLARLDTPLDPVRCQGQAPVQEITQTGPEIDIRQFPVPFYSPDDGGPFITPGIVVSRDPETGVTDLGHYRFQILDRAAMAFLAQPFHRFGKHLAKALALGMETYRAALVVGTDPVMAYACQVQTSDQTDDYTVAGGLRGAPVELVPTLSGDLDVPARAEVIFELEVALGEFAEEGPLGEYTGYYTPASPKPVARVTAVTRRREPCFQGLLTGRPVTENHILKQVPFEASLYRQLKSRFPTLHRLSVPASGGVSFIIALSMRPRFAGEARQAILAALSSNVRPKWVVAVDPDIDVYSSSDLEWAVAYRVRPEQDVFTIDHLPAGPLDPSVGEEQPLDQRTSSAVGIDATRRLGAPFPKVADVPGWAEYSFPELDARGGAG